MNARPLSASSATDFDATRTSRRKSNSRYNRKEKAGTDLGTENAQVGTPPVGGFFGKIKFIASISGVNSIGFFMREAGELHSKVLTFYLFIFLQFG